MMWRRRRRKHGARGEDKEHDKAAEEEECGHDENVDSEVKLRHGDGDSNFVVESGREGGVPRVADGGDGHTATPPTPHARTRDGSSSSDAHSPGEKRPRLDGLGDPKPGFERWLASIGVSTSRSSPVAGFCDRADGVLGPVEPPPPNASPTTALRLYGYTPSITTPSR
jgi:hypothetical protein